jgi:hypothetical protein
VVCGGLDYRSGSSALRQFAKRSDSVKTLAQHLATIETQLQKNEI